MGIFSKTSRDPIVNLAKAIGGAIDQCSKRVRPHLSSPIPAHEQWFYIRLEFLYFFMHLTNRMAFTRLGQQKRTKLQERIGPLVVPSFLDASIADWPKDIKHNAEIEVYEQMNRAEVDYARCERFLSSENPLDQTALFPKLARRVAEASGNSNDISVDLLVIGVANEAFCKMDIVRLIEAAGKVV